MSTTPVRPVIAVALVAAVSSCHVGDAPGYATAYQIQTLAEAIGGPKAIAQPGDYIMDNGHMRVAILGARNSLGPGIKGGSIVDADRDRPDPEFAGGHGLDQFAELFPTINMNVTNTDEVAGGAVDLINDGNDGKPAVIRVQGPGLPFLSLLDALYGLVGAPDVYMSTDYIAEPGKDWLTLHTTVGYGLTPGAPLPEGEPMGGSTTGIPIIPWAIESGVVAGEFYLSGGAVDVFAPGIGFDEDGAVYREMQDDKNTFLDPFDFPFIAGTADGVSYGIAAADGDLYVPLFTSGMTVAVGAGRDGDGSPERFPAGSAYTYDRYFFVGDGDVGSIVDQVVEAKNIPYGTVAGFVSEQTTGTPLSGIDVFVYQPGADYPWSEWKTDVSIQDHSPDGSFGGRLPVGEWELLVHDRGRPETGRVKIEVKQDQETDVALQAARHGVLTFTVKDELGRRLPCKVTLFRVDDDPVRDAALGDTYIGGHPEEVVFPLWGEGEVELAPGKYEAVASRGLEYELAESAPFTVDENTGAHVDLQLVHSVNTDGWISADLHVHSIPSHDSGVMLADRVRSMVAEGVEFFSSTDHDFVTDFAPTVQELGMEEWVQTAVGNEVTTLELGHFLGFPLAHDFMGEAGSGDREKMDWTGKTPESIIGSIRGMGQAAGFDPVVFVGHPRDGILGYFDQYGFDPYSGTPGLKGAPGTPAIQTPILSIANPLLSKSVMNFDFDAIELLNGKREEIMRTATQPEMDAFAAGDSSVYEWMERTMAEQTDLENGVYKLGYGWEGHIDDWFTLLNLGFKYTVLGNSDTHSMTTTEAGCPRNFVMSETDDPSFIDDQAVADAVKAHQVVASYGPFIQFWADNGGGDQPIGSEITGAGKVTLTVDVQAPTWIDVDRVELYENGTLIHEWNVDPTSDVLKLHETTDVTPAKDSWYVVIAMGDGDLAPVFTPVEIPYIELQSIVTEALGGVEAVSNLLSPAIPVPKEFAIHPFAITNPIWVDLAGDGFDAPGVPAWQVLAKPVAPE